MTPPMTPRESKLQKVQNALASGSGDHAELARLADDLRKFEHHAVGSLKIDMGEARRIIAVCDAHIALLAENAALRAESESARTVVAWANNSLFGSCGYFHGDPYDGLHLARPIEALKDRATEAERKLAEAVGLLREAIEPYEHISNVRAFEVMENGPATRLVTIRTFLSKEAERG